MGCDLNKTPEGLGDHSKADVIASGRLEIEKAATRLLGGDGTTVIGAVAAGVLLPNGSLLLADRVDDNLVMVEGLQATPVRVGRKGSGPGEFRQLTWIGYCGQNRILAWDARQQLLSIFDEAARFQRSGALTEGIWELDCASDGTTVASLEPMAGGGMPEQNAPPFTYDIVALSPDSIVSRQVLLKGTGVNRPLGLKTVFRAGRGSVVHGTTSSNVLIRTPIDYDEPADTIALALQPLDVDSKMYAAAIERQLSALLDEQARAQFRSVLARIPPPDSPVYFRDFRVSSTGYLWVIASLLGNKETVFAVFDSSGDRVGEIAMRGDVDLLFVSEEMIVTLRETGAGGQAVEVYRYSIVP